MRFLAPLAGLLLLVCAAIAHDRHGDPNWIGKGMFLSPIDASHCCGVSDCTEVDSDDVRETVTGYELRGAVTYGTGKGAKHQWLDELVPHREVQRSRDGNYWRCKKPDGSRRCFFAPPPST